jgi:hypothetical protein
VGESEEFGGIEAGRRGVTSAGTWRGSSFLRGTFRACSVKSASPCAASHSHHIDIIVKILKQNCWGS